MAQRTSVVWLRATLAAVLLVPLAAAEASANGNGNGNGNGNNGNGGDGCLPDHTYAGELVGFPHEIDYNLDLDGDRGLLADTFKQAYALLDFQGEAMHPGDPPVHRFVYKVWGVLGDFCG